MRKKIYHIPAGILDSYDVVYFPEELNSFQLNAASHISGDVVHQDGEFCAVRQGLVVGDLLLHCKGMVVIG